MTSSAGPASVSADIVESWFVGRYQPGLDEFQTWRSRVGDRTIEFVCTDQLTAETAAARLIRAPDDGVADLRLGLLETRVLGWAPAGHCESQERSLTLMRELDDRGISAIIPVGRREDSALWVLFRAADHTGLVVVDSVTDLPPWMVNAPFSLLLHLAFALRGQRLVHAASLGSNGRGALIVGPGGAGKSATTISGLLAGLATVGDDYLVLDFTDPPTAWPVYRTLKQSPAGLWRLPIVLARTIGLPLNWHGKVEFDADLVRAGGVASDLTVDAILIPRQERRVRSHFERAPPTAAFSALAPSTLSQLPGVGLPGFSQLTRLTRSVPAFWLHLSADPEEVGASLREFIARLR